MRKFSTLTGQRWKYRAWQALTVAAIGVLFAFFSLFHGNPLDLPETTTIVVYFATLGAWLGWYVLAIRCPRCGKSPVWYQFTHGSALGANRRLLLMAACPACGFDPAAAD